MDLPALDIAGVRIEPALALAPMSGVTDSPFRRLVRACSGDAVGLLVSEFISVEMLTRRTMQSRVRMAFHPSERPVAIQIFGSEPGKMAEAARMIEDAGADVVDINCGCPAPKVVKKGGGAGLLRDLPLLARILDAVVAAVSIPVTVKIRNGWSADTLNALDTLRVSQDHGARAIGVHGRTREQLYRGEADWDVVRAMVEQARIPVLGSGDVVGPDDARARWEQTGCHGILVGRAAITNPWVFRQIADGLSGRPTIEPTWAMRLEALEGYLCMLRDTYHPKVVPGRMKMMLSRLLKGFPTGPEVRLACLKRDDPDEMLAHLRLECDRAGLLDPGSRAA
ncbi:MAG: tRNA dihydrouridine synthase DusB [Myxococcota bacterium]